MKNHPVVDLRLYTMRQGGVPEFLRLAHEVVLPVQLRHIGPPVAYYVTDIGPQQEVMHLWGYESLADMEVRRNARNQDPEWPKYGEASDGLIDKQETSILRRIPLKVPQDAECASADKPLVEFRVTTLHRRRLPEFLRLFESQAMEIQMRHVGAPIALYTSDVGHLNQVIQIWGYDSYADMEARRKDRDQEPRWASYLATRDPLVVAENVRIVRRVPGL
jgi:hypothetical protein